MHEACYNHVWLTTASQHRGNAESLQNLCCTQAFVNAVHNSITVICLLSLVSQFTAAISCYSVLANAKCSVQSKTGWFILFKPTTIIDDTAFNNLIETILSRTGCIHLAHNAVQQASLLCAPHGQLYGPTWSGGYSVALFPTHIYSVMIQFMTPHFSLWPLHKH